jgi:hypothetical protein
VAGDLVGAGGGEGDAVLVVLDFFGYSYVHIVWVFVLLRGQI